MKRFVYALIAGAFLALAAPVHAFNFGDEDNSCQNGSCNTVSPHANGGSAKQKQAQKQKQRQKQSQKQKTDIDIGNGYKNFSPSSSAYSGAHSGSLSGALSKGYYQNEVSITDQSVITYEEKYQAPTMFAPSVNPTQLNVECPLFVQDGWSGSLSGPGAGAAAGATDAEAIAECFAKLVAENSTGTKQTHAKLAMYCLAFERIEVENTECVGWRETVGGEAAVEAARARETSTFSDPADRS